MNAPAESRHASAAADRGAMLRAALIAAGAAIALYAPTLRFEFIFDDIPRILGNQWLRDWRSLPAFFSSDSWMHTGRASGYYRPLVLAVYLALYQAFGPSALAFHAVSVLLHAANAALLVLLVGRVCARSGAAVAARPGAALVAGLVFAAHPANTAAVAWVSGIDNSLFTCFGLAALLAHDTGRPWAGGVSAMLLALSMLSRENALAFLPLLGLYDLATASAPRLAMLRSRLWRYGTYAAVTALCLALRAKALGGMSPLTAGSDFDWRSLLMDGPVLLGWYLLTLALPAKLAVWPDYVPVRNLADVRFLAALAALAFLGFAAVRLVRRSPPLLLGLGMTLLPLSLALYLPPLGYAPLALHRLYLSTAGAGMLLAAWLSAERPGRRVPLRHRTRIGFLIAAALAARAVAWAPNYADSLTFWTKGVLDSPRRWMPHLQFGLALVDAKRADEGLAELRKAQALDPANPLPHHHLARAYQRLGRQDLAEAEYRAALAVDPAHFPSLAELGQLAIDTGRDEEALALLQKAAAIAPWHPWVRDRLGAALFLNGSAEAAVAEFRAAARLAPWDAEIRRHLEGAEDLLGAGAKPRAR